MIALLILAAHMVGDYVTQTQWMAENKLRCWSALAIHVSVYVAGFVPVMLLSGLHFGASLGFLCLLWVTHFVTDCRRWASGAKWPPKPILVDQTIHVVTLAVLGLCFGLK
jgi:hypothetical protein